MACHWCAAHRSPAVVLHFVYAKSISSVGSFGTSCQPSGTGVGWRYRGVQYGRNLTLGVLNVKSPTASIHAVGSCFPLCTASQQSHRSWSEWPASHFRSSWARASLSAAITSSQHPWQYSDDVISNASNAATAACFSVVISHSLRGYLLHNGAVLLQVYFVICHTTSRIPLAHVWQPWRRSVLVSNHDKRSRQIQILLPC